MIEVVISEDCPHCEGQLDVMRRSFFEDEYRVIKVGSSDFEEYSERHRVEGVPYIIVRDAGGPVRYAGVGLHDGTELRKIERGGAFNLRKSKVAVAS